MKTLTTEYAIGREHLAFIQGCVDGRYSEVIGRYYAQDVFLCDADGIQRHGRDNVLAFQRQVTAKFKTCRIVDIQSACVTSDDGNGNSVLVVKYSMQAELASGTILLWPKQVQVSYWRNQKILSLFYSGSEVELHQKPQRPMASSVLKYASLSTAPSAVPSPNSLCTSPR